MMAGSHYYSVVDSVQGLVDAGSEIRSANPVVKLSAYGVRADSDVAILTGWKFGDFENLPPSWHSLHGVVWEIAGWRRTMAQ